MSKDITDKLGKEKDFYLIYEALLEQLTTLFHIIYMRCCS